MPYAVLFQPAARRELGKLERPIQRRVVVAIEALASDPHSPECEKMSGFRDVWRIRVGIFRIVYRIEDRQLIVEVLR